MMKRPIRPMVRSVPKPVPRKEVKESKIVVAPTSDPFGGDPFAVSSSMTTPTTKKKPTTQYASLL
jgi:hypothetical protein